MKRNCSFIILLIFIFGCWGCGENKTNKTFEIGASSEDSQAYWNIYNHQVTSGENGYYYVELITNKSNAMNNGMYIYYMDKRSEEVTLLCNKPECDHNNIECNAYLPLGYGYNQIYYYKGNIYVYRYHSDDGLVYLVQISEDGSQRKELFDIGIGENTNESKPYCLTFYDDSVYIYVRQGGVSGIDNVTATIRRRSLDGKEDENIYEHTSIGAQVYGVKNYGNKIFFLVEEQTRPDKNSREIIFKRQGLFAYDCNTKNTENIIEGDICDYTIDTSNNVMYYYIVNDGLYKQKLSEKKPEKIYKFEDGKTNICQLSFDGKYVYMNNELYPTFFMQKVSSYDLYIMDNNGTILNTIKTAGPFTTFFGDSEYLFSNSDAYGNGELRFINKNDILTNADWNTLR